MRKKVRLRIQNPDETISENEIEIRDNDIIICSVPLGFTAEHADKMKQMFIKAFTQEGPNLIIIPEAVTISIMRVMDENAKG